MLTFCQMASNSFLIVNIKSIITIQKNLCNHIIIIIIIINYYYDVYYY